MNTFKKCLPDVVAILLFALIGFAYFFVPVTQNKVLFRHDSQASKGLGAEQINYYERTGERTRWVNNLFSGMPTYQISPSYNSTSTLSQALQTDGREVLALKTISAAMSISANSSIYI